MSTHANRRFIWSIFGIAIVAVVVLDVAGTVAEKLRAVGLYGEDESAWVVVNHDVPPAFLDPIVPPAPAQNSIVGVCQSTDAELGGLAASLSSTLTNDQVDSITRLAVQRAGGLDAIVDPGDWVVIKPNILNFPGESAFGYQTLIIGTSTDLRVIKSLMQQLVEEGDASRITISEGGDWWNIAHPLPPALDGIQTEDGWTAHWPHYGGLSYEDMIADFNLWYPGITFDIVDMNYPPYTTAPVPGGGLLADTYTMPDVLNCDVLIPVATMKTHNLARITCILKHYIGVAPGEVYGMPGYQFDMNKLALPHGDNIEKVLIDLFAYHPADFSLVECFWGMEGQGPNSGIPIKRNVVLASSDPVALDAADAYVMGFNPWDIDYLHWAHNRGWGTYDMDHISVTGPALASVRHEFIKARALGRGNRIWLVNGTYDGSTNLDAEQLGAGVEATISPVAGQMTQGNAWSVAQFTEVSDYCDLNALYGGPSNCVSYAFTRIVADYAQTAYLRVGADDGMKVWLNGSVVYNSASVGGGGWNRQEAGIPISLVPGSNRLLLKISNVSSAYGFSLITTESSGDGDTPLDIDYQVTATPAPEVVLHTPTDGVIVPDTYADLVTSVTDGDGDSMTVWIYGGTTPAASDLLYMAENVPSGTVIQHTWNTPSFQVTPDTRGLWHLNENGGATTADASGNGNTGVITGAVWTTAGKYGPGLDLAPGDVLDVGTGSSLNPLNEVTYEAWVNFEDLSDIVDLGAKVFVRDYYAAMIVRTNASLRWEVMRSGTVYDWDRMDTPPGSVPMGEWVYVAGTCDSTGLMKSYVNGQMLATQQLQSTLNPSGNPTYIGWWPNHLYDGRIDEIRISSRALTEAEILANYRLAHGTTYYWKVMASDGTQADTSETRSFAVGAATPDTQAPEVTLNSPDDGAELPESSLVVLDATVWDAQNSPVEVWIYGDSTASPTTLLYHQNYLFDTTNLQYTWGGEGEFNVTGNTVALWHFNENVGTTAGDETGSHDGVVVSASWDTGRFGPALHFDNADRVEIPDSPDWDTPQLTVQAWVNASSLAGGYNCILTKGSYPSPVDLSYCLAVYNGRLTFLMGSADGSGWSVLLDAMGATTLATGTWYHVAVTYDGSHVRLYLDGELDANGSANPYAHSGGVHYSAGPVDIGSSLQQATADRWYGLIDEVRMSDVALSDEQVRAAYLLDVGRYYWYVQAADTAGNVATTPTRYFDVGTALPPPDVPDLQSPADAAVLSDNTPTFAWSATAGTGGTYTLQIARDAGFTLDAQSFAGIGDTTYTPGGALSSNLYYWHVQAIDAGSRSSGYQTTPYSFTVDTDAPAVPELAHPPDGAATNETLPTFIWSATAGSGGTYTLAYALDPNFTIGVQTVIGITDTTYTPPSALTDAVYYWHVEAVDQGDNASGFQVTPFAFSVDTEAPAVPSLFDPADQSVLSDNMPSFEWSATSGPGGAYTLQIASDSDFTFAMTASGLTDTTYQVAAPLMDGDYYWHVAAMDHAGNASGYQSAPFRFSVSEGVPPVPILLLPSDSAYVSDLTPTFVWSDPSAIFKRVVGREISAAGTAEAAAFTYTLQYARDPAFSSAITVSDIPVTTYTVPGSTPLAPGTCYWRVEAVDGADQHSGYQTQAYQVGIMVAGDQNQDGVVTASDVIYLVNFVFKGGPDPRPCQAMGDSNCDGAVTAGDIIFLVNHTFKGGPPPCDVGELISNGTWTCP